MLRRILSSLFISMLLTGCNHYNYAPSQIATPFITEKNESNLSAGIGGLSNGYAFDLQGVYNPWKNVSVMANYFQFYKQFNDSEGENKNLMHYGEAGVGGWHTFSDTIFHIGLFVGGGHGTVYNDYGQQRLSRINYNKAFLQPTFTITSRFLKFGFATRFCYLGYRKGNVNSAIPGNYLKTIKQISVSSPFYLTEAGFNLSGGNGMVDVMLSYTVITNRQNFGYKANRLNFGVLVDVDEIYKKKNK